ncbi:mechanosensitive ion channel family protein [Dietzia sp. PP-33]|jgi:small-conductance mechanosensitive channel|uniref:mechanosensitive ion channel family protein n=1 Tax=Dietzia sp. PP-33 TaxID=2957500 RepID=UPI0029A5ADA9|nr:mechanosensitive ion channel domain-containing protein [Dietzia sp. PP-33]MDX2356773.1 mechanosensitive ion channel family protein [Dietzia sp. PP-33]
MVDTVVGFLSSNDPLKLFGVTMIGVSGRTVLKVLLSALLLVVLSLFNSLSRTVMRVVTGPAGSASRFWTKQGLQLLTALMAVLGLFSIWVTPGTDLTVGIGLVTAGLAFALQKVIASLAGYFVILRGRVFAVGDRIAVGGVRGDVMSLGFLRTTVMEMGAPSSMTGAETGNWVPSRQFTGRVVTVSNGVIFDEAVYNYSRGFPFLWEEISVNLPFDVDLRAVDELFATCADRHTHELSGEAMTSMQRMSRVYAVDVREFGPQVFVSLQEDWILVTVRFVVGSHGARAVKDAISRDLVAGLKESGISPASVVYDIRAVGGTAPGTGSDQVSSDGRQDSP